MLVVAVAVVAVVVAAVVAVVVVSEERIRPQAPKPQSLLLLSLSGHYHKRPLYQTIPTNIQQTNIQSWSILVCCMFSYKYTSIQIYSYISKFKFS